MRALDAAVTLADASGWTLTNLQLQKLLYITQMFHLGEHGGLPAFNEDFQAWKLGPVLPAVYGPAKVYGSRPVKSLFHKSALPEGTARDTALEVYNELGQTPAFKLVAITHWDKGAWAKHYRDGEFGRRIPKEDILNEYRTRQTVKI
ncbi:DUF4065 domain-containing protein [Pacificimonas sp. WHA3]|uniref:DUF4065 domain-containing protein n=1 Tax=Pacificimonas pallii TaxID=2827236 RepID=A0ABS6SAY5_9SPHN|nr:type II toxin-antitoxin system antitoxin SocA domain-containing protein [Pacificimonas pallii]MBV7255567.1 DUF4065 domain-containing protein [Pacificimonas pallii]